MVWGNIPLWIFPVPNVDLKLIELKKEWTERNADNIVYLVQEYVKQNYYQCIPIFTDGSKNSGNDRVGVGVYIPEFDVTI